jgi:hypothetical protein
MRIYLGFDGNRLVNDFHAQLAGGLASATRSAGRTEPRA